jgi:hypothetical protein
LFYQTKEEIIRTIPYNAFNEAVYLCLNFEKERIKENQSNPLILFL